MTAGAIRGLSRDYVPPAKELVVTVGTNATSPRQCAQRERHQDERSKKLRATEATKTKAVEKHVPRHWSDSTHRIRTVGAYSPDVNSAWSLLISNYRVIDLRNQVQIEAEFGRLLPIDSAALVKERARSVPLADGSPDFGNTDLL